MTASVSRINRLVFTTTIILLILVCPGYSVSQNAGSRGDPIVVQMVELEHADAEELATVLRPFLSKDGSITAYTPGNILIIKDRKSTVEALLRVIKGKPSDD